MIKKTQKIIIIFEGIRVETTVVGIDNALMPLVEKLYDDTVEWQAIGISSSPGVSMVIRNVCVSAMWHGKAPVCKPRIKEIFSVETNEFLAKQYTN